jgi:hypothetical protein
MMKFHQSSEWQALAKKHKTIVCRKCGADKHIESDHILPQGRFKLFRLWKFNLQYLCGVEAKGCNLKKSDKLDWWYWKTWLLLGIYGMIKLIKYLILIIIIITLGGFVYYDQSGNAGIISGQIMYDAMQAYEWVKELVTEAPLQEQSF